MSVIVYKRKKTVVVECFICFFDQIVVKFSKYPITIYQKRPIFVLTSATTVSAENFTRPFVASQQTSQDLSTKITLTTKNMIQPSPKLVGAGGGGAYNSGILFFAGITVLASLCVSFIACKYYNDKHHNNNSSSSCGDSFDENDCDDDDVENNGKSSSCFHSNRRRKNLRNKKAPIITMNNGNPTALIYNETTNNVWSKMFRSANSNSPPNEEKFEKTTPERNTTKKIVKKPYTLTVLQQQTLKNNTFEDYEIEITSPETYV